MVVKLDILEILKEKDEIVDPDIRLKIDIHLNKMKLTIQKKLESLDIRDVYTDDFEIDEESDMTEIFHEFYKDYIRLTNIEYYWNDILKKGKVVEINMDLIN
jgi:hypothetical protein